MDYPQLNLLLGLAMVLTNCVSVGLASLLTSLGLRRWVIRATWLLAAVSALSAVVAGFLVLGQMPPATSSQLALGMVAMVGLAALAVTLLLRRGIPAGAAPILVGLQVAASAAGILIALALIRSLVPLPPPWPGRVGL
jgi:hypothetical protein